MPAEPPPELLPVASEAIPPPDDNREILKHAADYRVVAEIEDVRLPENFSYEEKRPTCHLIARLLQVRRAKSDLDPGETIAISYGCFQSMLKVLDGYTSQPAQIWMQGDRGQFEATVVEWPSDDDRPERDLEGLFPSVQRGTPMLELDLAESHDYRPGVMSRLGAYLGRLNFDAGSRREFGMVTAGGGGIGSPAWRVSVFDDGRVVLRQGEGLDQPSRLSLRVVRQGRLSPEVKEQVFALTSRLLHPPAGTGPTPQTLLSFNRVEYLFLTENQSELDFSPPGPVVDGLPGALHRLLKSMLKHPNPTAGLGGGQLLDTGSVDAHYRPLLPAWGLLAGGGGLVSPSWRVVLDLDNALLSWARSEQPGAPVFGELQARGQRSLTARERRQALALAGQILDPAREPVAQEVQSGDAMGVLILSDGIMAYQLMPPGPIIAGEEAELHGLLRSLAWPER